MMLVDDDGSFQTFPLPSMHVANQYANEFNYVQEFYARMRLELMQKLSKDTIKLFQDYDTDHDDLLVKDDI